MRRLSSFTFILLAGGGHVQALKLQVPDSKAGNGDLHHEISFLRRRYEQAESLLAQSTLSSLSEGWLAFSGSF